MDTAKAINFLEKQVSDPQNGLPDDIFLYISRTVPMVNIDLLIKDEKGRALLAWRDDKYCGKGWHLPGGVVRFKETLETRVKKVAKTEIGVGIKFDPVPIAVNQVISRHKNTRGHFISILYKGYLKSVFIPQNKGLKEKDPGYLRWHSVCPDNLLKGHDIYRKFL